MKTTIDIADALLLQAKKLAREQNTTLKAILEEALRKEVAAQLKPARAWQLKTHTVGGNGLQPGLTWGDWDAIRRAIYDGRGG